MIDVQELQDLIAWFERNRNTLPQGTYRLKPWLVVADAEGFYRSLEREIRLCAGWPASQLEPLAARLRMVKEYCEKGM